MIRIASLFSGVGGFEKGIQQAAEKLNIGVEFVFASEFDPDSKAKNINNQPARQIYRKNFGWWPDGDITKTKPSDVPEHDILVGGPPCQGFSMIRDEIIAPLRSNTGAGHNNVVCHSTQPRSSKSGNGGTGHLERDDGLSYCLDSNNSIAVEVPENAKCLTGGGHSGGNHSDMTILKSNNRIRRLTPIEVERLQGFPDHWTEEGIDHNGNVVKISDTQRYKVMGNAVSVPVIEFIAERLLNRFE